MRYLFPICSNGQARVIEIEADNEAEARAIAARYNLSEGDARLDRTVSDLPTVQVSSLGKDLPELPSELIGILEQCARVEAKTCSNTNAGPNQPAPVDPPPAKITARALGALLTAAVFTIPALLAWYRPIVATTKADPPTILFILNVMLWIIQPLAALAGILIVFFSLPYIVKWFLGGCAVGTIVVGGGWIFGFVDSNWALMAVFYIGAVSGCIGGVLEWWNRPPRRGNPPATV